MKCSFCGSTLKAGTGTMFVKKDAKLLYFCKSKCRHNMIDLGRKPRNTKWTAAAHAAKKPKK